MFYFFFKAGPVAFLMLLVWSFLTLMKRTEIAMPSLDIDEMNLLWAFGPKKVPYFVKGQCFGFFVDSRH